MARQLTRAEIDEATQYIALRSGVSPRVGLILGSGLASLAAEVTQPTVMPYSDIPHFAVSTVEGHPGELVVGQLEGCPLAVMRGRVHYYEGYSMPQVTFPIRVMWALGIRILVITNAAGGLNPAFSAGDVMLITDHIGLVNMVGLNPLHGPNDPQIGPRFPDMTQVYDPALRKLALQAAADLNIPLQQGVYLMQAGPCFETPAELRFVRSMGADAVGMSTVPEATVARHAGIRVLGFSGISNVVHMEPSDVEVTHEEVLQAGKALVAKLTPLIKEILRRLEL
jgi:purine-nucleoside phosphorylase